MTLEDSFAGPFLDLRSPIGVTPAALKAPATTIPGQTPESSPAEKSRKGAHPGSSVPQANREVAIRGGEAYLP